MIQFAQASGGGGGTAGQAVPRNWNEIMGIGRGRDRWDVIRTAARGEAVRQQSYRKAASTVSKWPQRRAAEKGARYLNEMANAVRE